MKTNFWKATATMAWQQALILGAVSGVVALATYAEQVDFGQYSPLVVAICVLIVNWGKTFLTSNSQTNQPQVKGPK